MGAASVSRDVSAINMKVLRIVGGLASLIIAGLLLLEVVATAPVLSDPVDRYGEETTFYYARRFLGMQLSGWQLLAFAFTSGTAALAFCWMGFYALAPRRPR